MLGYRKQVRRSLKDGFGRIRGGLGIKRQCKLQKGGENGLKNTKNRKKGGRKGVILRKKK